PNLPTINIVTHAASSSTERHQGNGFRPENQGGNAPQTLRQFVRSMSLDSTYERIAAIAYYQNRIIGRGSFSPRELSDWFTQAGLQKPSQMPVALSDGRRRYGYVESVSRGEWRITTNGENLIVGKLENGPEQPEE